MSELGAIGIASAVYALLVLGIGALATRRAGRSPDDYFLAGRGLGTLVLFMALFGTNATTFVLVGIPGLAYRQGVGVFGYNVPIIALGIPLTFWLIGAPARRMASRLGALTPAELFARRFDSRFVGLLLFVAFTGWTLPYMLQAVRGASLILEQATAGAVPVRYGAAGVVLLALVYTGLGGMLATAWTNVLQGALFLGFVLAALAFVPASLGGLGAAMEAVREHDPSLLVVEHEGLFAPRQWTSWGLVISLCVIGFPHMLARLMAAKDADSMRRVVVLYPIALGLLWVPVVLIGVLGAAAFPGLERSDEILFSMTAAHMPAGFAAVAFVAVLAAVMSTLDAMILTLSSMLVRDVLRPFLPDLGERRQVALGRAFAIALGAAVYVLALGEHPSIFQISSLAFEGYVMLVPLLFFGVRWRRATAAGAVASVVLGNAVLFCGWRGAFDTLGFRASFFGLLAAIVAGWAVSLVTRPTAPERVALAFGDSA